MRKNVGPHEENRLCIIQNGVFLFLLSKTFSVMGRFSVRRQNIQFVKYKTHVIMRSHWSIFQGEDVSLIQIPLAPSVGEDLLSRGEHKKCLSVS